MNLYHPNEKQNVCYYCARSGNCRTHVEIMTQVIDKLPPRSPQPFNLCPRGTFPRVEPDSQLSVEKTIFATMPLSSWLRRWRWDNEVFPGRERKCQCEREGDDERISHAGSMDKCGRISRVRIWKSVLIAGKLVVAQPPTW
jgi:hypothetical protein